jgi:type I restriction enzyme, S subunit
MLLSAINLKTKKLSEVCSLVTDGTHDTPEVVRQGIPFIKAKEIVGGSIDFENCDHISYEDHLKVISRSKPEKGDILFAHIGASMGETAFIKTKKEFSIKNVALFKPDSKKINNKFLYYYVISPKFQNEIKNCKRGTAQPFFSLDFLRNYLINYPEDHRIQMKIAVILSAYDDLIENNTHRIKILEKMAQAIYSEWFINFHFPGYEGVRMVESELGLIPEGWEIRKLGDKIELCYGKGLKTENRKDGTVPVFGSSGIIGYHDQAISKGPGIIIGRKGNVGSIYWSDVGFYPIDTVYYVKSKLALHYTFYNLQKQNFLNNDAAVPGLNRNQAYSLPLLVPDSDTLDEFEKLSEIFFNLCKLLEIINTNLRYTRDLLLPKLISGEIDVGDLDIKIPEAEA